MVIIRNAWPWTMSCLESATLIER